MQEDFEILEDYLGGMIQGLWKTHYYFSLNGSYFLNARIACPVKQISTLHYAQARQVSDLNFI